MQQQGRRAGTVVPPPQLEYGATVEDAARAAEIRRAHPLYASIVLGEGLRATPMGLPPSCCPAMLASLLDLQFDVSFASCRPPVSLHLRLVSCVGASAS